MASISVASGGGATANPFSSGNTNPNLGLSPNADAMSQNIAGYSAYNLPYIDVMPAPNKPYEIFGIPATGPLAAPLPAIGSAVSNAANAVGNFFASEAPNFPVTTDPFGNPVSQRDPYRKEYPLNPNAYAHSTPVLDDQGKIIGYAPVGMPAVPTQQTGSIAPQQSVAPQNTNPNAGTSTPGQSLTDQIAYLESSQAQREQQLKTDIWGTPDQTGNYTITNKNNYLGLQPGYVPSRTPNKPGPNASLAELQQYKDALTSAIRMPLYKADAVDTALSKMDDSTLVQTQKAFLAARLYSSNAPITFGDKGVEERNIMAGLMARANYNGTTWEAELQNRLQAVKSDAAKGINGSGGGSGPITTQVQYSMTSLADARRILTSVLQQTLGRNPTDSELSDFMNQLNSAERKSPSTSITTRSGNKAITRTTPSSTDANQMALDFAKQIGGGDEYTQDRAQFYLNLIAKRYGYGFGQG